jgi:hypothetical protein
VSRGRWRSAASAAVAVGLACLLAGCGTPSTENDFSMRTRPRPDALAGRCWPLPTSGFGFTYQAAGEDVRPGLGTWTLDVQWNQVPVTKVERRLAGILTRGGFTPTPSSGDWHRYRHADFGDVSYLVRALPGVAASAPVRGSILLTLPIAGAAQHLARRCPPIAPVDLRLVPGVSEDDLRDGGLA